MWIGFRGNCADEEEKRRDGCWTEDSIVGNTLDVQIGIFLVGIGFKRVLVIWEACVSPTMIDKFAHPWNAAVYLPPTGFSNDRWSEDVLKEECKSDGDAEE